MINKIFILGIILVIMLSSCGTDDKSNQLISDSTLGFIKSDVQKDDENLLGKMPQYSNKAPGTAQKIERSFENAPPMIPHMTVGFFPITKNNNICLSCHMPDKISVSGAVAIPESHFTDYRPKLKEVDGKYEVDAEEGEVFSRKLNKLSPTRYNCSQCHVPQANVTVDIKNNFERVFRNNASKTSSDLDKKMDEGVK
ncbi:MAG: nitrate reductase cytochrome c-type subunit; periplasmic nitrate reductase electron transfer subunit [Chlorobi bacterium]|nr:nitrate reductase cytochrome c-type subunit; periplasmic nitrate reductase electron transfer subunit [Chlorobiota bacterium]